MTRQRWTLGNIRLCQIGKFRIDESVRAPFFPRGGERSFPRPQIIERVFRGKCFDRYALVNTGRLELK